MREVKMNAIETEGYAVTVEINGDLEDYSKALLNIYNK